MSLTTDFEVEDLPGYDREEDGHLKDRPPFHSVVSRLGGVAVGAFTNDDVLLLIFDRRETVGQRADFAFNGRDNI